MQGGFSSTGSGFFLPSSLPTGDIPERPAESKVGSHYALVFHQLIADLKGDDFEAIERFIGESKETVAKLCAQADPETGTCALHVAAIHGKVNIARELLRKGADGALEDKEGRTFFHEAMRHPKRNYLDFITLAHKHSPNALDPEDKQGNTPFIYLCEIFKEENVRKSILMGDVPPIGMIASEGGFPNTPESWSEVRNSRKKAIQVLIETHRVRLNIAGKSGHSPLMILSANGEEDLVKLLFEHKADVDFASKAGTALSAAASKGHDNLVKSLLEFKADINKQPLLGEEKLGGTPLHFCLQDPLASVSCIQLLLECYPDLSLEDEEGCRALHKIRVEHLDSDCVVLEGLLTGGTTFCTPDSKGRTFLFGLIDQGITKKLIERLETHLQGFFKKQRVSFSKFLNEADSAGVTPLMWVAGARFGEPIRLPKIDAFTSLPEFRSSIELIRTMIKCGADPFQEDKKGRNMLDCLRAVEKSLIRRLTPETRHLHNFIKNVIADHKALLLFLAGTDTSPLRHQILIEGIVKVAKAQAAGKVPSGRPAKDWKRENQNSPFFRFASQVPLAVVQLSLGRFLSGDGKPYEQKPSQTIQLGSAGAAVLAGLAVLPVSASHASAVSASPALPTGLPGPRPA